MPQPLRYVILGAGGISQFHVDAYAKLPDVTPVGFVDTNPEALERWKTRFPEAAFDHDPVRLLEKARPDLVSVCSPNSSHAELTQFAFAAGAHVMCEKPMAMSVEQAEEMEAARQKADRLGAIHFTYRSVASVRFAREIIRSGELGRIQRMNVRYLQSWLGSELQPFVWRNDIDTAGSGTLGDLGVHMIDVAGFITGLKPLRTVGITQTLLGKRKTAAGAERQVTTDTNASFLMEYDNGAIGTFETSQIAPTYGNFFHVEISGDRGVLRVCNEQDKSIGLLAGATISRYGTWSNENVPSITLPSYFVNEQPKSMQEVFVKAIRGEAVEYATFADGVFSQRCMAAVQESVGTGRWTNI
ncbi:MAG: Gfo/Idh/MocA family oxidoreductase [Phycisphaerae bacterium]|nr:Gfo/Idh/MocA family oxidoreductase [Phycisphaerae bacterium]